MLTSLNCLNRFYCSIINDFTDTCEHCTKQYKTICLKLLKAIYGYMLICVCVCVNAIEEAQCCVSPTLQMGCVGVLSWASAISYFHSAWLCLFHTSKMLSSRSDRQEVCRYTGLFTSSSRSLPCFVVHLQ